MISKFSVGILLAVATLFLATPTNTFAATSTGNSAKIKKYFNKLNKLPNGASPASTVNNYVTNLVKLDPKKTKKYFKLGIKKLGNPNGTFDANATKIQIAVAKILKKSGLSTSQVNSINKSNNNTVTNAAANPPPITSASAMLYDGAAATLA